MVKLASLRPAFIDPDKIGALPSLIVLVPIASRNGGGNIRWDARSIRSAARWPFKAPRTARFSLLATPGLSQVLPI